MDKKDLEQIKDIVKGLATKDDLKAFATKDDLTTTVHTALGEFWTGNLEPAFDGLHQRIDIIETKLDKVLYTEVVHLEARIKRLEDKVGITHENHQPK